MDRTDHPGSGTARLVKPASVPINAKIGTIEGRRALTADAVTANVLSLLHEDGDNSVDFLTRFCGLSLPTLITRDRHHGQQRPLPLPRY